jgi:hypothetical protein
MNPNHTHYGDWTIEWEPVDPLGFDLWIGKVIIHPCDDKAELFRVKVGFFRDLDKGLKSCCYAIDKSIEEQKRATIELVEKYSRNRHSRPSTSEILGRNQANTE